MLIGLLHLHRTLAYLLFLVALSNLLLVLWGGRTHDRVAAAIGALARIGLRMGGGLTVLLGLASWGLQGRWPLSTGWLWVSLLLWVPVEVLTKRVVLPEVALVKDGGQATARLTLAVLGQLVCVAAIFGLMSTRP